MRPKRRRERLNFSPKPWRPGRHPLWSIASILLLVFFSFTGFPCPAPPPLSATAADDWLFDDPPGSVICTAHGAANSPSQPVPASPDQAAPTLYCVAHSCACCLALAPSSVRQAFPKPPATMPTPSVASEPAREVLVADPFLIRAPPFSGSPMRVLRVA
jgi:hypothetical protein